MLMPGSSIAAFGGGKDARGVVSVDGTKESAVCSGRGMCEDLKLGKCVCYLGYTNSNGRGELGNTFVNRGDCGCTSRIPVSCPGDLSCSGHGTCSGEPSWKCSCAVGWQGGDCADRTCPSGAAWFDYPSDVNVAHRTPSECSNVGTCDRSTGLCKCPRPYTGTACELRTSCLHTYSTVEAGVIEPSWASTLSSHHLALSMMLRCCSVLRRVGLRVLWQWAVPDAQRLGTTDRCQRRSCRLCVWRGPEQRRHVGPQQDSELLVRSAVLWLRLLAAYVALSHMVECLMKERACVRED